MRLPLLWRRKQDADLDDEINTHLNMAASDRVARGESASQAQASVRRQFGNLAVIKEVTREVWGWGSVERLWLDIRYGGRILRKNPGFSLVAILTLALGIGANTAMFSVLNAYLFRPLGYPHSEQLVQLLRITIDSQKWPAHSAADFVDQRDKNTVFQQMTAIRWGRPAMVQQGALTETLNALEVTADFFPMMQVQPALGRVFTKEEDQPGANKVAVLSDRLWKSRFNGDRNVLGRTMLLDGETITVIGVMPPSFEQPLLWYKVDLWRPLALSPEQRQNRGTHYLVSLARLKSGVSPAQAEQSMIALAADIREANPSKADDSLKLAPLQDAMSGDTWRKVVWFTFGLAGFVLLIACANLANLQLVRTASRAREHAMRAALGAGRFRLLRQSLTESLLVSLLGGGLSLFVAFGGIEFISHSMFRDRPYVRVPLDFRVFGFALVCSVLTGIIFGTVPAWLGSRPDVNHVLKENMRGSGLSSPQWLRNALIIGEVAFALMLLTGAGLFLRGIQRFSERDPGWRVDGLLSAQVYLQGDAYATPAQRIAFYQRLEDRLSHLPGVEHASLSQSPGDSGFYSIDDFVVEGEPEPEPGQLIAFVEPVSTGYFDTYGLRILAGRPFSTTDTDERPQVAIVNQTLARRFWPNENPIGKRIGKRGPDRDWRQIVGVVNDFGFPGMVGEPQTRYQIFMPLPQAAFWNTATIALRSSVPPDSMAGALRNAVAEVDSTVPVNEIHSMRDLTERRTNDLSLLGTLLGAFAALGLVLAAIGIYGVVSYLAAQRTGEIGVRMALGASAANVLWLIMGGGTRLVFWGALIGGGGGYAVGRLLVFLIPDLPTHDPGLMIIVALGLVIVGVAACYLPARRATQVDPMIALRYE